MDSSALGLLLLCLSHADDAERISRLTAVTPSQWQAVGVLAQQLYVAPLLHHRLKSLGVVLPEDVAAKLRQSFLNTTARNMQMLHELNLLLQRLHQENIPVIVLKGAYLAEAVYNNIGLRSMDDIDLLIPARDIEKAISAVETIGFKASRPLWAEADGALHYHAPVMAKNDIHVELHWSLTRDANLQNLTVDELWARAQRQTSQTETWVLAPCDLLLHLAVHAAYGHRFHLQFRSLYDLVEVVHRFEREINWDIFIQTCHDWQAERGTYLALRLIVELFNIEIPSHVVDALRPPDWTEAALDWAKVRLFQVNPVLSENYIRVMHSPNLSEKLSALRKGLFPSRAVMSMLYGIPPNSWRIIARYPQHAAKSIAKYLGHAWHLLRGDSRQVVESTSDQSLRDWLKVTD